MPRLLNEGPEKPRKENMDIQSTLQRETEMPSCLSMKSSQVLIRQDKA